MTNKQNTWHLVEHATCQVCGESTRANMVWQRGWCDRCDTWVDTIYTGYHLEPVDIGD